MIDLIDKYQAEISALCRRFSVSRLELFGSAAAGTFDPRCSDLDFLVEFDHKVEPRLAEAYLDFIDALQSLLGRDVDVVMNRAIRNPHFRQVVDRSRTLLYAA